MKFFKSSVLLRRRLFNPPYWPWLFGIGLLLIVAVVSIVQLPVLRLEKSAVDQRSQALEAQLRAPATAGAADMPKDLRSQLPTFDRLSVIANDLQALSTQNGLTLVDASYKPLDGSADAGLGRMEIGARLTGGYRPMKKAVAGLLASHEGLALESLSIRRSRSTDTLLEIDLRFTFYYRKQA